MIIISGIIIKSEMDQSGLFGHGHSRFLMVFTGSIFFPYLIFKSTNGKMLVLLMASSIWVSFGLMLLLMVIFSSIVLG